MQIFLANISDIKANLMSALGKDCALRSAVDKLTRYSCNKSDEVHHNRHKEILKLVRRIAELDEPMSLSQGFRTASNGKQRNGSGAASSSMTDTSSETTVEDGRHLTRSERKKAKKSGMNASKRKEMEVEVFPQEDIDFVSEAIHLTIHESKGAWQVSL